MIDTVFSLSELVAGSLVDQALGEGLQPLLDRILIVDADEAQQGIYAGKVAVALDGAAPQLPLLGDIVSLDFGGQMSGTGVFADDYLPLASGTLTLDPFLLAIQFLPGLRLRFSPDVLVPLDGSDAVTLPLGTSFSLVIDQDGVHLTAPTLTLPKCGLGATGVVLTGGTITLALWGAGGNPGLLALGIDDEFRGIVLQNVGFQLPEGLDDSGGQLVSALKFSLATIGLNGFSGRVEVDFGAGASLQLFGAELAANKVVVAIEQNALSGAGLTGTLTLPFFNTPVTVAVALHDGGWAVSLSGGLAELTVNGVIHVALTGLGIERRDGDTWFKASGTLHPMLDVPGIIAGSDWPELELRDVMIDQHGHVKASGGKMALTSQKVLKIGQVMTASLTHFGFGTDPDGYQAVSLSGWVSLIEGLSVRASFNDLKIRWKTSASGVTDRQFSLAGAEIDVSSPGVFEFKGVLAFVQSGAGEAKPGVSSHGFNGAIHLGLPTPGLTIDGQLAVREVTDGTDHYTALFITLDLELPAGIPLLQSGLAIYGFNGLLAWHFGPAVQGSDWIGWFLGPTPPATVGVTQLAKWQVDAPKKGLGAGITIGTLADTGFSWNARTTFIVVIPGPILVLSGDGSFVSKGMGFDVKGALGVALIFDGTAQTLSAAISADVGKDPVVHVTGAADAFFDFNRPEAWYLDIGTKPRPLQAKVLQIFDATSYLGLTMNSLALGVAAGYDKSWSLGPLSVHATAKLEGEALIIRHPLRFTGNASLDGLLDLRAFGVGVTIGLSSVLDADLAAPTAVTPLAYHLHFGIDAFLTVKVLVKKVTVGGHIDVNFDSGDMAALMPPALPLVALSLEHAHSSETWPLAIAPARNADGLYDGATAGAAPPDGGPLVPPDALPTLVFGGSLNDMVSGLAQNPPVNVAATHLGNADYTFALTGVSIDTIDEQGAATTFGGTLTGKWSGETDKTRLQIWADTPYFLSRLTEDTNRLADHQALRQPPPCKHAVPAPSLTCASMADAQGVNTGSGCFVSPLATVGDLTLELGNWRAASASAIAFRKGDCVRFPEPVVRIEVQVMTGGGAQSYVSMVGMQAHAGASSGSTIGAAAGPPFTMLDAVGATVPYTFSLAGPGVAALACDGNVTTLRFEIDLAVTRICWITQEEQEETDHQQAAATAAQASLGDGVHANPGVRPVLAPWSRYRITVTTTATRAQDGAVFTFTDVGYFRSGGPPALVAPAGLQPPGGAPDQYPLGGPLADLGHYLAGSIPAADSASPAQPETAYRGYDPALVFNEGYVVTLYDSAQAKLTLEVLDQNSRPLADGGVFVRPDGTPVTDAAGTTIAATPVENEVTAHWDLYRQLWHARLDDCDITQSYPPDTSLVLPLDPRLALEPRRRYTLRATAGDGGAVVCQTGFRTSRYLTVTHQLQSHPDLVVTVPAGSGAAFTAALANCAAALPSAVGHDEGGAFEALWDACALGTPPERDTLDVVALMNASGAPAALLVTSPEPLPWDRIAVQAERAALGAPAPPPLAPQHLKITDAVLETVSYVELMLLEDSDPSGLELWGHAQRLYRFASEGQWPSGTIFRVYAGSASPASTPDIQGRNSGKSFPSTLATVSVRDGRRTLHRRPVLVESAYGATAVKLVRKRDGTGAFFLATTATGALTTFAAGMLRVAFTIARDVGDPVRQWTRGGDGTAERTRVHVQL